MFNLVTMDIIFDYNGNTDLNVLKKNKIISLQKKEALTDQILCESEVSAYLSVVTYANKRLCNYF